MEKRLQVGAHSGPVEDLVDSGQLAATKTVRVGVKGDADQYRFSPSLAEGFGERENLILEGGKVEDRHDRPIG
jgi:hypothetical protein